MAQLFKRIGSKSAGKTEHLKISASLMSLGYGKVSVKATNLMVSYPCITLGILKKKFI